MAAEKILVVDDEQSMTQFLGIVLRKEGFQVTTVNSGRDALDKIRMEPFDVVISDIKMPGMDGIQLLQGIKKHDANIPVVLMTAYASQQSAIDAVNLGAFQYLLKNAKNDEIRMAVRNALEMRRVRSENQFLKRELKKGHEEKAIIGSSEEMIKVFKMVDKVADSEATILIQVKLLRALQEREIIPVGGTQPVKIDCRLVAATNVDLEREVAEGRFRADLFFRLNVIPLRMPALRQRRDDIPLLVDHFLKRHAKGGTMKTVSKEAMELLMKYDWPGNVRELENVMERALILDEGGVITAEDLPDKIRFGHSQKGSLVIDSPNMTLEELEKEYILKVLNFTRWQKKRSSELLGINASTLYRKLISYGLEKPGKGLGEHGEHDELQEGGEHAA